MTCTVPALVAALAALLGPPSGGSVTTTYLDCSGCSCLSDELELAECRASRLVREAEQRRDARALIEACKPKPNEVGDYCPEDPTRFCVDWP